MRRGNEDHTQHTCKAPSHSRSVLQILPITVVVRPMRVELLAVFVLKLYFTFSDSIHEFVVRVISFDAVIIEKHVAIIIKFGLLLATPISSSVCCVGLKYLITPCMFEFISILPGGTIINVSFKSIVDRLEVQKTV